MNTSGLGVAQPDTNPHKHPHTSTKHSPRDWLVHLSRPYIAAFAMPSERETFGVGVRSLRECIDSHDAVRVAVKRVHDILREAYRRADEWRQRELQWTLELLEPSRKLVSEDLLSSDGAFLGRGLQALVL